jgi:G3E family GTPase
VSLPADFDPRTLLDHGAHFRSFQADDGVAGSGHAARIRSFVVTVSEPIDWTAFGIWLTMLLNRHGDKVLRVKGILNLAGEAAPVAIHGVQQLVHNPVHMNGWPDNDRSSRIVFIVDGIDPALIRRSLAAFNAIGVPTERV